MEIKKSFPQPKTSSDPIRIIESEFLVRKGRNPLYSLRGYARDLGISPGQLSKIINRQVNLTRRQAAKIAAALHLQQKAATEFVRQSILAAPKNAKVPAKLREKAKKSNFNQSMRALPLTDYSVESFKAIALWYHLPLLELTYLDTFKADPKWISEQLGISTIEARDAIFRLLGLGLLERCPKKGLKKTINHLFVKSNSEPEVRKYEREMIDKAIQVLEHPRGIEKEAKLLNSVTFPIANETIPEVREAILEFHKKMLRLIQNRKYDQVYQFNCQFFPITKTVNEVSNEK